MEKEARLEILRDALDKAYERLSICNGDDFMAEGGGRLLYHIEELTCMIGRYADQLEAETIGFAEEAKAAPPTQAAETAIATPTPAAPENTISKEELREQLSALSNKHDDLDLPGIMSAMGHEKLSDFQPSEYAELLKRAKAAVKELT